MFDITTLFSSRSKLKVLRTLCYQRAPLPLRHIAYLADRPLYSVQRVLKQLDDEKVVVKKKQGNYMLFSLNRGHRYYWFLIELFNLEMKSQIAFLSNDYHKKAKAILAFSSAAHRMIRKARSWT